ncbi:predicted protein [Arabidopsis lyrata subsp. lyrata]|uniref:Predicted protein n=1 Tax=Arabidopsis lyrata subsp. lyrata TaxID=81972 RepID=D7KQ35_ARALL|nr:predicted protein [Arabidopsis lyrata subsp. lyrata]
MTLFCDEVGVRKRPINLMKKKQWWRKIQGEKLHSIVEVIWIKVTMVVTEVPIVDTNEESKVTYLVKAVVVEVDTMVVVTEEEVMMEKIRPQIRPMVVEIKEEKEKII